MSMVHKDFIFLHPPKTGGHSVRGALRQYYGTNIKSVQPYHGLPYDQSVLEGRRAFMFVRHPALWLRSFWGDRMKSQWQEPNASSPIWNELCACLDQYKSDNFVWFAESVVDNEPGVVGQLFSLFLVDGIEWGYTEHLGIGLPKFAPLVKEVPVKNPGRYHPRIPERLWITIEDSERFYMNRFGLHEVYDHMRGKIC